MESNYRPLRPKNWLVESILVTILCCLPFGIVGIIYAAKIDSKYDAGDYAGAESDSRQAGLMCKIGFFAAILPWFFIFLALSGVGIFTSFFS